MDRIRIRGGNRLNGTIPISGAKNAALPLMIASLLTRDTLTLSNMPLLADVTQLERILGNHGVDFAISGKRSGQSENAGRTVHFTARCGNKLCFKGVARNCVETRPDNDSCTLTQ